MTEIRPGQTWQRLLALAFGACAVWLYLRWAAGAVSGWFFAGACLAFVLFFLLSIPPLYRRWMLFAEWLSVRMVRLIFSLIYFLFLPFLLAFRSSDRLGLKAKSKQTFWRGRAQRSDKIEDLQRMA